MKKIVSVLLALCVLMSAGCAPKDAPSNQPVSALSEDGLQKPVNSGEKMSLNILNWGDYIDEEALAMFRAEYPNIDVSYETMTSNEEMLVMLSSQSSIYDICFPSDYIIQKLIEEDLLAPIDKAQLPHMGNIDERFMNLAFDPGNQYSVPYLWGTVGILYNTTKVNGVVDSWDVLWDEAYSKQIFMYDSVRDSMGVALKRLGYSMNTHDPVELAEAEASLVAQKPLVSAYGTDWLRDKLISDSGTFAVVYSGDALFSIGENSDLDYCVPKEGSNIWFDNVVLMKNSKNKQAAHLFIDFLCRSDIAKMNTQYIGYSTPNKAALEKMDQAMVDNVIYNPPKEVTERCEAFVDLGDALALYNDAWTRVKASKS